MHRKSVARAKNGYFGIGVYHPKSTQNIGTLMRSAYAFGASYVFTVGRRYTRQASDTVNSIMKLPLYNYDTVEDLRNHLPSGSPLIGIELAPDAESLLTVVHPAKACYLLGAEDHGIPSDVMLQCHKIVQIPYAAHCLNVSVAGSIIMYDRCRYVSRNN